MSDTPSPAAMRAAKAIYISLIVDVAQRRQLPDESELAAIIDSEIGTAKVVEAMEAAWAWLHSDCFNPPRSCGGCGLPDGNCDCDCVAAAAWGKDCRLIRAALAAMKGATNE